MKKRSTLYLLAAIAVSIIFFWGCGPNETKTETTSGAPNGGGLPQDVKVSCTVSQSAFDSFFVGGKVTENGKALPANSVTFQPNNNCSFYTWSEQMFLWITSPTTSGKYVPGNTVLESPVFYDVTTLNNNQRKLTQHDGKLLRVSAHISQNGPNDLPLVTVENGMVFEVEGRNQPEQNQPMLQSEKGGTAMVATIEQDANGNKVLYDKKHQAIHPKPLFRHKAGQIGLLAEIKRNGISVLVDSTGAQHTEVGQATQDVLMAQNGSLVYYLLMVNDVYAYFMTGCKNGAIDSTRFPTTDTERNKICSYARQFSGATLSDSNALAMELKTAWVETNNLPNLSSYIVVNAEVPEYDTTDHKKWVPTGKYRRTQLALIGMHIVGSLTNHPEMSWATFEHVNNAPNAAYQYLNTKGDTITVPPDTGKAYLLSSKNATTFNASHMKNLSGDTITGYNGNTVSASNTQLVFPFGSQMNTVTNPEDKSSAAANSEIIGMNNAVMKMLMGNDVRKNYLLIGATWTSGGTSPNGKSYSVDTSKGSAIGADMLANSTMETYFQKPGKSCFTCHNQLPPTKLSHIFKNLQALPAVPKSMK